MAISFERGLGVHQYTLGVRTRRAEVLSSNIANADTPGYKAKDIDFASALEQAKRGKSFAMSKTHHKHHSLSSGLEPGTLYRNPNQADTGDGNTVDVQTERALFMQNSLEYQSTMSFLNSKISGMRKAIKGE